MLFIISTRFYHAIIEISRGTLLLRDATGTGTGTGGGGGGRRAGGRSGSASLLTDASSRSPQYAAP